MLEKVREKLNALIETNKNKNNKKTIENLVVFVIILIVTIITINAIWSDKNKTDEAKEDLTKVLATTVPTDQTEEIMQSDLEKNLQNVLSKIKGVGNVEVLITYSESSEIVAMYNETTKENITEENDTSGGKRIIEQKDTDKTIAYEEESGRKTPVTQKIIMPTVTGAVIIAQGANNSTVKAYITQAVEAATGLATHKIQVFEMN